MIIPARAEELNGFRIRMTEDLPKCQNFLLCEKLVYLWWLEHEETEGIACIQCEEDYGPEPLRFVKDGNDCPVCMESPENKIALRCGHRVCVSCFKTMYQWDDSKYHVSVAVYGGPSCPEGCINLPTGRQCYCASHVNGMERWYRESPADYMRWDAAMMASVNQAYGEFQRDKKRCPLCRTYVCGTRDGTMS